MRASALKAQLAMGKIEPAIEVLRVGRGGYPVLVEPLKETEMKAPAKKPLHLQLLVGGIAAILISSIAIGSLASSPQGSNGAFAPAERPEAAAAPAGAGMRWCAECGMIEATQKIEVSDELIRVHAPGRIAALNRDEVDGKFVGKYAITIRMQDGSTRVITDAHPARWRPGERVKLIGGME